MSMQWPQFLSQTHTAQDGDSEYAPLVYSAVSSALHPLVHVELLLAPKRQNGSR